MQEEKNDEDEKEGERMRKSGQQHPLFLDAPLKTTEK